MNLLKDLDDRVARMLRLIKTGKVRWEYRGAARLDFFQAENYATVDLRNIAERLYHRIGWKSGDSGEVELTEEGQRRLDVLEGEGY